MKREELTLSPELAKFVDSFSQLAIDLPRQMLTLCAQIEDTEARMRALTQEGVIRAIPDWRIGGKGEYLTLVFPPDETGKRPRKFVGRDRRKIQAALSGIERAEEYERLQALLYRMMEKSLDASTQVLKVRDALAFYQR